MVCIARLELPVQHQHFNIENVSLSCKKNCEKKTRKQTDYKDPGKPIVPVEAHILQEIFDSNEHINRR